MTTTLGILITVAVIALAGAMQLLSIRLRERPLDLRRSDPLIDVRTMSVATVRPAELHRLTTVVANAVVSDASYRSELQPILDELTGAAPPDHGHRTGRPGRGDRVAIPRRGRSRRSDRVESAIADLERRWGLAGDGDAAPPPPDRAGTG